MYTLLVLYSISFRYLCFRLLSAGQDIVKAAEAEKLLLETYNINLPVQSTSTPGPTDQTSVDILQLFQSIMLKSWVPLQVVGDGNCLFRAVSRALYNRESCHQLLRLLTAIEMIIHPECYDSSRPDYQDLIKDVRAAASGSTAYGGLVKNVCLLGAYMEMHHIYALSAVVCQPIKSYFPPTGNDYVVSGLNRSVCGRGVTFIDKPAVWIMWTCTEVPKNIEKFQANHFSVLHKITPTVNLGTVDLSRDVNITLPEPSCSVSMSDFVSDESERTLELSTQDISKDESISINIPSERPSAKGGIPLSKGVLSTESALKLLLDPSTDVIKEVPRRIKEDVAFIFDNSHNVKTREIGGKSVFWDDCGSWEKGTSPKTTYIVSGDMNLTQVTISKEKLYCVKKTVRGSRKSVPIQPQPHSSSVMEVQRNYSNSAACSKYMRRVTWINKYGDRDVPPVAVVEYVGTYPGDKAHGNSTDKASSYVRSKPEAVKIMSEAVRDNKPSTAYKTLKRELSPDSRPNSTKQLENKRYNDAKKEEKTQTIEEAILRIMCKRWKSHLTAIHLPVVY